MRAEKIKQLTEGFVEKTIIGRDGKAHRKFAYQGDYYVYFFSKWTLRQSKIATFVLTMCSMIVLLCSLLCKDELNVIPYVGGLAFLALIPMSFVVIGTFLFLLLGEAMRVQQYQECQKSIYYGAACTGTLIVVSVAGILFYLLGPNEVTETRLMIFAANLTVSILQLVLLWMHRKEHYRLKMLGEPMADRYRKFKTSKDFYG